MRVVPSYLEGRGLRAAIEHVLADPEIPKSSLHQIRRKLENSFNMNQITAIPAREVIIKRDGNLILIDATYESRVPLVLNIDAVVKHDTLLWEFTRE